MLPPPSYRTNPLPSELYWMVQVDGRTTEKRSTATAPSVTWIVTAQGDGLALLTDRNFTFRSMPAAGGGTITVVAEAAIRVFFEPGTTEPVAIPKSTKDACTATDETALPVTAWRRVVGVERFSTRPPS